MDSEFNERDSVTNQVYQKRYFILLTYFVLSFVITIQWIQYTIIPGAVRLLYSVDVFAVNLTSTVWFLSFLVIIIPVTYLIDKLGLRNIVIIGAGLNVFGTTLKCLSATPDRFWLTLLSQTLVSISGVFIYSIPTQLTATWFADHEVSTATSVALTSTTFGTAIGYLIPPLIIRINLETIANDFLTMFIAQAIVSVIMFIVVLIYFDEKPLTAPSIAQQKVESGERVDYVSVLKQLVKNSNYNMILIAFGISKGVQDAVASNLGEILLASFPEYIQYSGIFGLLSCIIAVPGSVICGRFMDKTRRYKLITLIVFICVALSYASFITCILLHEIYYFTASILVLGLFEGSVSPLGFEFAVETTYPLTPGVASGFINASYHFFGCVFNLIFSLTLQYSSIIIANIVMLILYLITVVLSLSMSNDLRRQKANECL